MAILQAGMHATGCKSSSPRFRCDFLLGHSCRDAHSFSHVRVSANPTSTNFFSHNFTKTRAVGGLLDRAIATHEICDDISPEDLLRALVGTSYMHDQPCWQTAVRARRAPSVPGKIRKRSWNAQPADPVRMRNSRWRPRKFDLSPASIARCLAAKLAQHAMLVVP